MASEADWEFVGRQNKKNKGDQKMSPSKEMEMLGNMPRISQTDPIELDDTLYSVFLPKEPKKAPVVDATSAKDDKQNGSKKSLNQKKKKPEEQKKTPKRVQIEIALSTLNVKDLRSVLTRSQTSFPDHSDIWLKDLASYLNNCLEDAPDSDQVYKNKPAGFPLTALSSAYASALHSFIDQFSKQTLDKIYHYGIQTMLQESVKGIPVHGYRLFLQLLTHSKPDIVLDKLPQYLELLRMHQNNPSKCLSVLWVLGQCGNKNFNCGLKVWLELMLPALEVKQVAHYPVEYLETLIASNKKAFKKSFGLVTLREYFQVLDVFFSPKFTLANDLKKRLTVLYPTIKTLAYGESPSQTLRTFFPSYLTRFANTSSKAMKEECLECLTECLITDKQSFSVWCQLYTKHLQASSELLSHINSQWAKLCSRFDQTILKETLRSFSVTNDELEIQTKGKLDGLKPCQTATKDLLLKMSGTHFPWSLLVIFLISIFASIVVYDIMSSSTFRSSKTMQFLEHYGILAMLEKTYHAVSNVVTVSIGWLKKNFPIVYTSVRDTVVPFCVMLWNSSKDLLIQAELHSRPYRVLAMEKAVQFYHWVYELSPEFWIRCEELVWLSWDLLKDYSFRIWRHSVQFAGEAEHWLTEHVLTGSLSKKSLKDTAVWGVEHLQNCTTQLVSWTKAYFMAAK